MDTRIFGLSIESSYRWRNRLKPWMLNSYLARRLCILQLHYSITPVLQYSSTPVLLTPPLLTPAF